MEIRRKLQHLRTVTPGHKPSPDVMYDGEIAINMAKDNETLMIKNTENEIVEFGDKKFVEASVNSRVFIGTEDEYNAAYAEGKIAMGALVIILDGSETEEGGATISALLGTAILGQMLLGQK
jgi:hypothetical protein